MAALTEDNVKFLALARATDKAILTVYIPKKRDGNEKYMEMLQKVLCAPTWKQQVEPNSKHTLECEPNKFHFTMDCDDLVFIAITTGSYPIRLAFKLLAAMREEITPKYGAKALTCRERGLDKDCLKALTKLAKEYDDRTKHDKIAEVQTQVDNVKVIMQDNIQTVLNSTEKMESVEQKTSELNEQAKMFRNTGKKLRNEMWWKNMRLNFIIGFATLVVLFIILASLGVFNSSGNNGSKKRMLRDD